MSRGLLAATLTLPLLTAAAPAVAEPTAKAVPVAQAIKSLPGGKEDRTGYKRTSFKHWVDADRDGCSTRNEVLIEEATHKPQVGKGCKLSGGQWLSYYDGKSTDNPRSLDIDHMVPLAEAWDSGASKWDADRRMRYANDLDADRSLVAVTARENRQKADKDPADWWVSSEKATCQYLSDWVSTKKRWKLAVDEKERAALNRYAGKCPELTIKAQPAS